MLNCTIVFNIKTNILIFWFILLLLLFFYNSVTKAIYAPKCMVTLRDFWILQGCISFLFKKLEHSISIEVHAKSLRSCPTLCNPMSTGFSRAYWSGLPCPPPGDVPNPGIKHWSPVSPTVAGRSFTLYHLGSPEGISLYVN